ncbi:MAG: NADAR family protein [Novosphingobium sp.]|jgi:ribA/ribD-fused uncharacterized protein|nr:NADAR family protein [Novosphingobium sp.]
MVIWFYSKTPEYGWLSNFSVHPFVLDGERWASVEHYYQAQKYAGSPAVVDLIRDAASPSQARKAGQDPSLRPRVDWGTDKVDVMRQAIGAKFAQHVELQGMLIATGDDELVHESDADDYWGRLRSGAGDNRLGLLLMQLRAELRGASTTAGPSTEPDAAPASKSIDFEPKR